MANSSNNKYHTYNSIHSPYGLWILFLFALLFGTAARAQPYFNRLYTNNATGSIYMSVCPQGNAGNFMAIAYVSDSSTGNIGIRASRFNTAGVLQQSNFFTLPDYPARSLYTPKAALTRINDNLYVLVGEIYPVGKEQYAFILKLDSNGLVTAFKDIINPYPSATDSFMRTVAVGFDGANLIMLSHIYYAPSYTKQLLTKFDTALNTIWSKTYIEGANPRKLVYSLHVDDSGYVLGGNSDWGDPTTKTFQSEAFVFRTDTSGLEQWSWKSPLKMGPAADIIRTTDGGYVFSSTGNVYDANAADWAGSADWLAQEILVKLNDLGKLQWQKTYDAKYSSLGTTGIRLLATADSGYRTMRSYIDSPSTIDKPTFADIRRFNSLGSLLSRHIYRVPTDSPVYGKAGLHDLGYTSDRDIVMVGYYDNRLAGAAAPAQRGWIVKLDSNGCMGASDPQCDPTSIAQIEAPSVGYNIYPNPSSGSLTISPHAVLPTKEGAIQATVYDLLGRVVHRQALSFSNKEASLLLRLAPASYILELQDSQGLSQRERIVIQ